MFVVQLLCTDQVEKNFVSKCLKCLELSARDVDTFAIVNSKAEPARSVSCSWQGITSERNKELTVSQCVASVIRAIKFTLHSVSCSDKTATSCLSQDEPEQVVDVRIWNCGVCLYLLSAELIAVLNVVSNNCLYGVH